MTTTQEPIYLGPNTRTVALLFRVGGELDETALSQRAGIHRNVWAREVTKLVELGALTIEPL